MSSPGAWTLMALSGLFFFAGVPVGVGVVLMTACVVYGYFVISEVNSEPILPGEEEMWFELDGPTRMRLKPLFKLSKEIQGLVQLHHRHPVLAVLGQEMMEQVGSVLKQSVEVGQALRKVSKLQRGASLTQTAVSEIEAQLAVTQDPVVRASLESALASRRQEMRNYEQMEALARRLDAYLHQAEGTLAELRSRVALVVAQETSPEPRLEDASLPALTERLKSLSATMKESVEALTPINGMAG